MKIGYLGKEKENSQGNIKVHKREMHLKYKNQVKEARIKVGVEK